MGMEKFPNLLPQLGMHLEISQESNVMVVVWEGERVICLGVGSDILDALRRAERWFWQEMVDRKLAELL